jgi:hypothetical protein
MNVKHKAWLALALVAVLLVACAAQPESTATPTTSAETIQVDITPSARFTAEAVTACDAVLPNIEVRIFERFPSQADGDLLIRLGAPEDAGVLAQITDEEISAVLHPDNTAAPLTLNELAALFSGQVTNWSQLGGADAAVNVWALLPADETRQTFDDQMMAGLPIVPDAGLAPDPAAMWEAVSNDPDAIGYLPDAWLDSQLIPIPLGIHLPVLAAADQTMEGPAAELVACLQGPVSQLTLSEHYP